MRLVFVASLFALGCGDNHAMPDASGHDGPVDAPMIDGDPTMPQTLFDTGLCVDKACTQISSNVYAYTPQFALWADTASKRRWMYLPPGTQIDTTDMDHWLFPQGTKFWKEFTRDNVRVETRLIYKTGAGNTIDDWYYVAYQWNPTQTDTTAVPMGVMNANGTQHDIPPRSACRTCHENFQPTRILGFGAIQLDKVKVANEIDLDSVVANGWLTTTPAGTAIPRYPLPGTAAEKAALGYMHANCGHCHNPNSKVFIDIGITMVLRLPVASLGSTATTPPYLTAVNVAATKPFTPRTKIIVSQMPDQSIMIVDRFEATNAADRMPQLGTEMRDPTGDATLRAWITALP